MDSSQDQLNSNVSDSRVEVPFKRILKSTEHSGTFTTDDVRKLITLANEKNVKIHCSVDNNQWRVQLSPNLDNKEQESPPPTPRTPLPRTSLPRTPLPRTIPPPTTQHISNRSPPVLKESFKENKRKQMAQPAKVEEITGSVVSHIEQWLEELKQKTEMKLKKAPVVCENNESTKEEDMFVPWEIIKSARLQENIALEKKVCNCLRSTPNIKTRDDVFKKSGPSKYEPSMSTLMKIDNSDMKYSKSGTSLYCHSLNVLMPRNMIEEDVDDGIEFNNIKSPKSASSVDSNYEVPAPKPGKSSHAPSTSKPRQGLHNQQNAQTEKLSFDARQKLYKPPNMPEEYANDPPTTSHKLRQRSDETRYSNYGQSSYESPHENDRKGNYESPITKPGQSSYNSSNTKPCQKSTYDPLTTKPRQSSYNSPTTTSRQNSYQPSSAGKPRQSTSDNPSIAKRGAEADKPSTSQRKPSSQDSSNIKSRRDSDSTSKADNLRFREGLFCSTLNALLGDDFYKTQLEKKCKETGISKNFELAGMNTSAFKEKENRRTQEARHHSNRMLTKTDKVKDGNVATTLNITQSMGSKNYAVNLAERKGNRALNTELGSKNFAIKPTIIDNNSMYNDSQASINSLGGRSSYSSAGPRRSTHSSSGQNLVDGKGLSDNKSCRRTYSDSVDGSSKTFSTKSFDSSSKIQTKTKFRKKRLESDTDADSESSIASSRSSKSCRRTLFNAKESEIRQRSSSTDQVDIHELSNNDESATTMHHAHSKHKKRASNLLEMVASVAKDQGESELKATVLAQLEHAKTSISKFDEYLAYQIKLPKRQSQTISTLKAFRSRIEGLAKEINKLEHFMKYTTDLQTIKEAKIDGIAAEVSKLEKFIDDARVIVNNTIKKEKPKRVVEKKSKEYKKEEKESKKQYRLKELSKMRESLTNIQPSKDTKKNKDEAKKTKFEKNAKNRTPIPKPSLENHHIAEKTEVYTAGIRQSLSSTAHVGKLIEKFNVDQKKMNLRCQDSRDIDKESISSCSLLEKPSSKMNSIAAVKGKPQKGNVKAKKAVATVESKLRNASPDSSPRKSQRQVLTASKPTVLMHKSLREDSNDSKLTVSMRDSQREGFSCYRTAVPMPNSPREGFSCSKSPPSIHNPQRESITRSKPPPSIHKPQRESFTRSKPSVSMRNPNKENLTILKSAVLMQSSQKESTVTAKTTTSVRNSQKESITVLKAPTFMSGPQKESSTDFRPLAAKRKSLKKTSTETATKPQKKSSSLPSCHSSREMPQRQSVFMSTTKPKQSNKKARKDKERHVAGLRKLMTIPKPATNNLKEYVATLKSVAKNMGGKKKKIKESVNKPGASYSKDSIEVVANTSTKASKSKPKSKKSHAASTSSAVKNRSIFNQSRTSVQVLKENPKEAFNSKKLSSKELPTHKKLPRTISLDDVDKKSRAKYEIPESGSEDEESRSEESGTYLASSGESSNDEDTR